jgi:hypothetical protein
MIATINSFVSKVVGTVSGPLYSWGPKPVKKKPKLAKAAKAKKVKCTHKGKCKCN